MPLSLTSITGEKLNEAGIQNTLDLSYAVPNLSVSELGPGRQNITMRGAGSQRGSSSLVGIYLDESAVAGDQNSQIDLRVIDLERVEVLRGPQGTLYGEGSTGGTIRFITRDPELDQFSGNINLSAFDNDDGDWSQEMTSVVNIPLIEDVFAIRMAATYENKDGWIDQPAAARSNINDNELTNIRIKALWQATDALAIKATAINHQNSGGGLNIVNLDPRGDSNFVAAVFPDAPSDFHDDYELYSLTATYDFGSATLLSNTSYTEMDKLTTDSQFFSLQALGKNRTIDAEILTQEIRLSSSESGPLNWTTGVFYRDANIVKADGAFDLALPDGTYLFELVFGPTENNSKSFAVFGDASYGLTDRLEIGAGIRYYEDDREFIEEDGTSTDGTFDSVNPRAYLSYAFAEDVKAYVNIATGFRSGGFNNAPTVAAGGEQAYGPEDLISYEVGSKVSLLNGRLNADAALFYSEYTDIQFLHQLTGSPLSFVGNVGEAEMKGVEWSIRWALSNQLTLGFSGSVIDAEYTSIDENATGTAVVAGDAIEFVPDYNYSLTADYAVEWANEVPGFIRINYNEQGEITNVGAPQPPGVERTNAVVPVLRFLNASVGAEYESWELELFGRNLLDEDETLSPGATLWLPQARPRTVGVKVSFTF